MSSWLFGGGTANQPNPPDSNVRIQTSIQGRPIAMLWGTTRVAGNLIWYGGFNAQPVYTSSAKDKKTGGPQLIGYNYFVSLEMALCAGPINDVLQAWNNQTQGLASGSGAGKKGISSGGLQQFNGFGFTKFVGSITQFAWSAMTTLQPAAALNYRLIAYVAEQNFPLGSTSQLPNLSFEVQRFLSTEDTLAPHPDVLPRDVIIDFLTNQYNGLGFPGGRLDQTMLAYRSYCLAVGFYVSPVLAEQTAAATFIQDLLAATNSSPRWSSGILSVIPWGDTAITQGAINTTTDLPTVVPTPKDANGNPTNTVPTIQMGTGNFVADIGVKYSGSGTPLTKDTYNPTNAPATGHYMVSPAGLYYFALGDETLTVLISFQVAATASYQPDNVAKWAFTDSDFLPNQGSIGSGQVSGTSPVICVRKRKSDMLNDIQIECLDRGNSYDPFLVEAKNQGEIDVFGLRASNKKQYHFFCTTSIGVQSANLQLIREQIPCTYTWTVGPQFIWLDVEDLVTLNRPNMGLNTAPVRITEIQENGDGSLTFYAEDFTGTSFIPTPPNQANVGFTFNFGVDPGPVNDALIFQPPASLVTGGSSSTTQLWMGIAGNGAYYGGVNIYMSVDNVSYSLTGMMLGTTTMGVLTAPLASDGDPDTLNTLSVDLTESGGQLTSVTQASADALQTLTYTDGEMIAFETANLTGPSRYDLTYLRRANYGTTNAAHAAGTTFIYLGTTGQQVFKLNVPTAQLSNPLYFKFQPFNIWGGGSPDLATLPYYTYFNGVITPPWQPITTPANAVDLSLNNVDTVVDSPPISPSGMAVSAPEAVL